MESPPCKRFVGLGEGSAAWRPRGRCLRCQSWPVCGDPIAPSGTRSSGEARPAGILSRPDRTQTRMPRRRPFASTRGWVAVRRYCQTPRRVAGGRYWMSSGSKVEHPFQRPRGPMAWSTESRCIQRRSGCACLKPAPADPFTWSLSAAASSSRVRPGCNTCNLRNRTGGLGHSAKPMPGTARWRRSRRVSTGKRGCRPCPAI